jgi:hypothetical protein
MLCFVFVLYERKNRVPPGRTDKMGSTHGKGLHDNRVVANQERVAREWDERLRLPDDVGDLTRNLRIRAGCPWRLLPSDFPGWYHVWYYCRTWLNVGTF